MNRTFPQRKLIQMLSEKKKWPNVVWFKVRLCKEKEVRLNTVHHVCRSRKTSKRPFAERMKETILLSYSIFVPNQTILSDNIRGCV